ncbi:uncharacterized protein LOC144564604 [Carex rostrata]
MEVDTNGRRWRVTYTKHLKQKRKVYHDGFLEISASGDKVRLYDESENLIEIKILGKADSVECGKSFTMNSHLVDIADAVNLSSNPTVTPLAQQNGNKRNSFHRKSLHQVSNMVESNTNGKKAEPCTTGAPSSNSSFPQLLLEEWSVLYTAQLTQKAKKYHDGTLRLSQLGSHTKQVQLYDENERLLESKVLGKDDVLESGQTLIMQAHLVDISLSTIKVGKENCSVSSVRKPFQKPASPIHSFVDTRKEAASVEPSRPGTNSILKEWNVLYTTQLNKKAKTYHDGILRLSQATNSLTKQITLASEDSQILGSRHMKSFECIESGAECELPGYMVQVYDLRVCQEGSNQRSPLKQFVKSKTLMKNTSTNGVDYGIKKEQVKGTSTQTGNSTEMKNLIKSIPTNGLDYGTKKEQVKSMSTQTGNSTEMKKSTNTKDCVTVARRDDGVDYGTRKEQVNSTSTQTGNSSELKKSTNIKECVTVARRDDGVEYGTKKEQVKSMSIETSNSMEMKKSTNTKECVTVARRDARQILSVLKKPTAVPKRETVQVAKKAHLSSHLIQIDYSIGEEKRPTVEGSYDKDRNAYHRSLTSLPFMESGTQASEMQMRVKENCTSSGMHNSSSVLSDITISASYEGRCEGVNLQDLEKANGTAGTVEVLFADSDNFDFPSFDLGF